MPASGAMPQRVCGPSDIFVMAGSPSVRRAGGPPVPRGGSLRSAQVNALVVGARITSCLGLSVRLVGPILTPLLPRKTHAKHTWEGERASWRRTGTRSEASAATLPGRPHTATRLALPRRPRTAWYYWAGNGPAAAPSGIGGVERAVSGRGALDIHGGLCMSARYRPQPHWSDLEPRGRLRGRARRCSRRRSWSCPPMLFATVHGDASSRQLELIAATALVTRSSWDAVDSPRR